MSASTKTDKVEEQIIHYQKKLERYTAEKRNESLQYCIHKLKYLPVTVVHLERTGVGKSVNMLRNYDGMTGSKARALVNKWKEMVSMEEERESDQEEYEESNNHNESIDQHQHNNLVDNAATSYDNQLEVPLSGDYSPHSNDLVIEDKIQNSYNPYTSQADYLSAGSSSQGRYNPTEEYIPTDKNLLASYTNSSQNIADYSPTEGLSIDDNPMNGYGSDNRNTSEEDSDKRHKIKDREENGAKSHKNNSRESNSNKKHRNNITEEESPKMHRNKHKNKEKSKHKHKHHSKDKKKSKHSPSKSSHRRENKNSSHASLPASEKNAGAKKSHGVHSSNKVHSSKSNAKKSKLAPQPMNDFESALLGMDCCSPKPKKRKIHRERTKELVTSKASSSVAPVSNPLPRLPSYVSDNVDSSLQLSTSYKPMPQVANRFNDNYAQLSKEEEGLNYMFNRAKTTRQIYTGKASGQYGVVDSLFNQCIRVLQENIDALEYTGGIPYVILKPVFERATAMQLFNVENFNPYLLEDTGELWEHHCKKHFKGVKREEMETWRDMFIRCTDEKEQRLKIVTEKLERKFVTTAAPKRTTKLAEMPLAPGGSFKKLVKTNLVVVQPSTPSTSWAASNSRNPNKPASARPVAAKKHKMGAMMAKSLQMYKKICRR